MVDPRYSSGSRITGNGRYLCSVPLSHLSANSPTITNTVSTHLHQLMTHVDFLSTRLYVNPVSCAVSTDVSYGAHAPLQTVFHLPHRCRSLATLNLAGLQGVTESGVTYLSFLPALEQLCLGRCNVSDEAEGFKNLRSRSNIVISDASLKEGGG